VASVQEYSIPPCPNKSIEAVLNISKTDPDDGEIIFQQSNTHKKIGSFGLGGYSSYVQLLWSPDGKYAALQTHFTRHSMELFVFRVGLDGIQQVKIEDYLQNIYGRNGVLHGSRSSTDTPLKWLAPDRLLISSKGSLNDTEEDKGYNYEVEISIIPDADELVGWLDKITPAKQQ
jgi:hypothetical protein